MTDRESSAKTLSYGCAVKPESFYYGDTQCCEDQVGNKDCRLYSPDSLSNAKEDLRTDGLVGGRECPEDPAASTTTVTNVNCVN